MNRRLALTFVLTACSVVAAVVPKSMAADPGPFAHMDQSNPWYPDKDFPKLTTPQWVGEEGVEAVVVLAIDDMRDTAKYEQYLRPILNRLKQIDGRAPVSIMTCAVKPEDDQLQSWLAEGLSIDCHTFDHPCPLLQGGDFDKALATYNRCVDLLHQIPGNRPVAFRTPCCDSLNTVSPRTYSEITSGLTAEGHGLQIDSSVMNFFTSEDESIPRELVLDENGNERFWKYKVRNLKRGDTVHDNFVNYIRNYPYPYLINDSCWQFPCVAPSDWSAQHLHGVNNPLTIADWKAALDITVHKQGVFNLVFHPHGWMTAEQVVELIDHAVDKHGSKVKFLTFREAADRLKTSIQRDATDLNQIRLVDINQDGFLDVVDGGVSASDFLSMSGQFLRKPAMRLWTGAAWSDEINFPSTLWQMTNHYPGLVRRATSFVIHPRNNKVGLFDANYRPDDAASDEVVRQPTLWVYEDDKWVAEKVGPEGCFDDIRISWTADSALWRDFDGDGSVDLLLFHSELNPAADNDFKGEAVAEVWSYDRDASTWARCNWQIPVDPQRRTLNDLRFTDLNGDGLVDLLLASESRRGVWLMGADGQGWDTPVKVPSGVRILPFEVEAEQTGHLGVTVPVRTDNGFFIHEGHLCWQNEDTADLPDLIHRVSFDELLSDHRRQEARKSLPPVPVGAAVVDITPDYPVRLTGYGNRSTESEGVAVSIHARAMAIGGPGVEGAEMESVRQPLTVMVTVDNCGVPDSVAEAAFAELAKKHDIARERFAVSSTHTHSGPWLREFAPNVLVDLPDEHAQHLQQYRSDLVRHLVSVVDQAIAARRPGRLAVGRGEAGFAVNRRAMADGRWSGFGETPNGPVDHQLPVLAAHDTNGKLIAVLANYACHATTETGRFNQISGDWPGFAADMIEADHEGAVALIAIGCGADANPSPRGTHEQAMQHGRTVADEVAGLLTGNALSVIDPRIACNMARVDLPLGPLPTREEWEQRAEQPGHTGAHARLFLKMLDEGQSVPTTVPNYPVQTWCFGDDLAMVFLGGEVVVDYSIRLNDMFDDQRLWINAYSNDVPCYIASKRILREGGYEADSSMIYYARPTRLAPQAEDIICDAVQKLLPHSFYSGDLQTRFPGPKAPEDALASITTRPELRVELVAAEPLIHDPVAFDWDVQGRLWVVEMGDYPNGTGEAGGGRVQVLEDTDRDGRYDKATTFLQGLPFPTGISHWRGGVIITAAPDVIYAADTNGDLQADVRKVLYTGFGEGNQQHRVNGLRWGLDGWLYLGNGDSDGEITAVATVGDADLSAGQTVNVRGRDLKIQPDYGLIDAISGRTQFGRERDDFGNWFGNNNSNPIWHYVLEDHYLRRNPNATGAATRAEVSEIPGAAPVFPTSRTLARFNDFDKANRFTSACSTSIYRDTLLGDEFYGNAFTCEPVHNLVSRLVLERDGVSFSGHRADDERDREFFASSDNWCRPTMVRTGPDGALWISDMYRQVIEHPTWIPAEYQRKLDLRGGEDMGRIYRIVRAGECCAESTGDTATTGQADGTAQQRAEPAADLRAWFATSTDDITASHLTARLASPNGWWRDTAQRLLSHRGDDIPFDRIAELATSDPSAAVRVQALHLLAAAADSDAVQKTLTATVVASLTDESAEVRRHGLQLIEPLLDADPALAAELAAVAGDSSAIVQHQLALTVGEAKDDQSAAVLARLLAEHADNGHIVSAVYSSLNADNVQLVLDALSQTYDPRSQSVFAEILRQAAAFGKEQAVADAFETLLHRLTTTADQRAAQTWQSAASVLGEIRRNGKVMQTVQQKSSAVAVWNTARQRASEAVVQTDYPVQTRLAALHFVLEGTSDLSELQSLLAGLLTPETAPELQQEAAKAIAASGPQMIQDELLDRWNSLTPSIRSAAIGAMLTQTRQTAALLEAIRSGQLSAGDVDAVYRERLVNHRNAETAQLAKELFQTDQHSNRQQLVDEFTASLATATGDAVAGKAVFQKRCATCHKLQDIGKAIGADLAALKDRSTPAMLTAILDPNRAVESKFISYTALTTDGRTFNGMLLSETGNSLTLMGVDGKEQVIARNELEELISSNRSLMPEGLEKDLSAKDLIDVITFVQTSGNTWKSFPGNQPELVAANADGTMTLPASAAEIYGPNLIFEGQYGNLGWWQSTDDYAVWTIDAPASGHWTVEFDFACDNGTAGNVIKLSTGTRLLSARVPGTGTWNDYRTWQAGTIDLRRGRNQLIVSAPEQPSSALIDLRAIRLIPPE